MLGTVRQGCLGAKGKSKRVGAVGDLGRLMETRVLLPARFRFTIPILPKRIALPGGSGALMLGASILLTAVACSSTAKPLADVPLQRTAVGDAMTVHIAGRRLRLLVDSGSNQTVLDTAIRLAGVEPHRDAQGRDVGGRSMKVLYANNISLEIGGFSITLPHVVFSQFDPSVTAKEHIQGVFSPEMLSSHAAVLLDFPASHFRVFQSTASMRSWLRQFRSHARIVPINVRRAGGVLEADIRVGEGQAELAEIDTGATHTQLPRKVLGRNGTNARRSVMGYSGKRYAVALYPNEMVHIGKIEVPVTVYAWHGSRKMRRAVIGRDVLGRFAIAFPKSPSNDIWLVR